MIWQTRPLAEVADFNLGKMLDQNKNRGELRPYLANVNVRWGEFQLDDLREMRFEEHELDKFGVRAGDILMCEGGEPGRCAIWTDQIPGMMFQKALHRIRPHSCLDSRFLYYSFLRKGRMDGFAGLSTGSTIKHLPKEKLAKVEISFPPMPEQQRIAAILSAYDDLIENNQRRIALLEEAARQLYKEWFVRFRFPSHENYPLHDSPNGPLPEGWRWAPIKEAYLGLFDGPHATPNESDYGPIFLGIGNLTETGRLDLASVRHIAEMDYPAWTKRVTPQDGDIVFTYEATLNRYALIPPGFRGCLGRRLALIRADARSGLNRYLFLYFFTEAWREIIAINTLSGATVDRVPLSRFPDFPIMLPDLELISQFDRLARPLLEAQQKLAATNSRLAVARDLMLPRMMSGLLDVSSAKRQLETAA